MRRLYYSKGKGYGSAGASTRRRAVKGFVSESGSPREDIDLNNYTLRQRGRLMYMGSPIATSAIKTVRTNTVGLGLTVNPRPDVDFLGMGTERATEWVEKVKREFALWANKKNTCDITGMNNFYEMQQMLITSWMMSGDVFALIDSSEPTPVSPYRIRLRAIEADRVATPSAATYGRLTTFTEGINPDNGNVIYDGVEVDSDGRVVAYWIANVYPDELTNKPLEFTRIEAIGEATGMPNILHITSTERPEQYRGVSLLAPVIIPLLQINRYTEAELTAAVVEAFFTAFIKTEEDASDMPYNEATLDGEDPEGVSYDPTDYELGPGTINVMNPGESIELADPKRPASGFASFVEEIATLIGAALEIPKDILLKQFNSSYSASRGALLEAWKTFKMYRRWFVNDFCQPAYELWMAEAVAIGRIDAPGFFNDPAIRAAWCNTQWIGPSQGQLDPTKEIQAEVEACANGFSTHADSALRINGSDFDANMKQLVREQEKINQLTQAAQPEETEVRDAENNEA